MFRIEKMDLGDGPGLSSSFSLNVFEYEHSTTLITFQIHRFWVKHYKHEAFGIFEVLYIQFSQFNCKKKGINSDKNLYEVAFWQKCSGRRPLGHRYHKGEKPQIMVFWVITCFVSL